MSHFLRAAMAAALLCLGYVPVTTAGDEVAASLSVVHPWARATPPGAMTGAVYFTIRASDGAGDRLVGVSTPRAGNASLHRSVEENGQSTMLPVESAPVAPGVPLRFAPGGYHVMLMQLKTPLREGDRFPMTLRFDRAGDIDVTVTVESMLYEP